MAAPRGRRAKKAPAQRKPARKKAPTKKKRASRKKNAADSGPMDRDIKPSELRYKLKAAELEWATEEARVVLAAQPDVQRILGRQRRNDRKWKSTNDARIAAYNEVIDAMTPKLPEGFAIRTVDAIEGTVRAHHDPDRRGEHVG